MVFFHHFLARFSLCEGQGAVPGDNGRLGTWLFLRDNVNLAEEANGCETGQFSMPPSINRKFLKKE